MHEKLLLAINPNSGDGIAKRWIYEMVSLLSEKYRFVTVYLSKPQGDIINTLEKCAADYDAVVCCGGDGTLNETLNGVYNCGKNIPIGYIPTGTTNDFASSHGIPKNIKAALQNLVPAEPHSYDMGKLGERAFSYVAAFGAIIEVCYKTPQADKASFGRIAYLAEGAKKLQELKPLKMRITCGERIIFGDFIFGMVTNSISVGGFKMFPGGTIDMLKDGKLEITLVSYPQGVPELQQAVKALFNPSITSPLVTRITAEKVTMEFLCDPPEWTVDGEFGGKYEKVDAEVLPGRLLLLE